MTQTGAGWLQIKLENEGLCLQKRQSQAVYLDNGSNLPQDFSRQGPWNVDLRTPPEPEGSNGSLLRICRGHPDTFQFLIVIFWF